MANPVVTYTPLAPLPGQLVTVTVDYDPRVYTLTGTDQDGNVGTSTLTIGQGFLTISPAKTLTKVSDTGTLATFTFTA